MIGMFIFALSPILHELCHYIAAKWVGVRVRYIPPFWTLIFKPYTKEQWVTVASAPLLLLCLWPLMPTPVHILIYIMFNLLWSWSDLLKLYCVIFKGVEP